MIGATTVEGKWADRDGVATIEVAPSKDLDERSPEVWLSVGGDTAEVMLAPSAAVMLAQALLTIAAPAAGTARQFVTGAAFLGSDPGPSRTIWLLDIEPLT